VKLWCTFLHRARVFVVFARVRAAQWFYAKKLDVTFCAHEWRCIINRFQYRIMQIDGLDTFFSKRARSSPLPRLAKFSISHARLCIIAADFKQFYTFIASNLQYKRLRASLCHLIIYKMTIFGNLWSRYQAVCNVKNTRFSNIFSYCTRYCTARKPNISKNAL
jgi:hypothetical protein